MIHTLKDQIDEAARKYASDYFTDRTSTDYHDDVRAYTAGATWAYQQAIRDVCLALRKESMGLPYGPMEALLMATEFIEEEFGLSEGEK